MIISIRDKGLSMLWTTQSCGWYERLRIPWVQSSRCYELLRVVDNMNDSTSWAQASRCYEQIKAMEYMNDSELWSQGSRCYKKLKAVDEMNVSGSWA